MNRPLHWVYRRRRAILGVLGLVTVGYGVLIAVVPWRFCHSAGYVIASAAVLVLFVLDGALIRERRR